MSDNANPVIKFIGVMILLLGLLLVTLAVMYFTNYGSLFAERDTEAQPGSYETEPFDSPAYEQPLPGDEAPGIQVPTEEYEHPDYGYEQGCTQPKPPMPAPSQEYEQPESRSSDPSNYKQPGDGEEKDSGECTKPKASAPSEVDNPF